jgi:hypothetical protein
MKLRLRTLRIGETEFRWTAELCHYDSGSDCYRCVRVRVWGDGKNSQVLRADLRSTSEPGPWGRCTTDVAFPTPGAVRKLIDYAQVQGWKPSTKGDRFVLDPCGDWDLSGFVLTDRLRMMQHLTG